MAMVVEIDEANGATPTYTSKTNIVWNQVDSDATSTEIPTPTATGTNFSFVKSLYWNATTTNSLSATSIKVGKVANETTTGTKLWALTTHTVYTQATVAPASTADNNVTAPTVNGAAASAMPLIGSASAYIAGPISVTGRQTPIVEVTLGVDATNVTAGTAVATPTLRWSWSEG